MNVGSLFSGIGGLDLGLERAGMRVVWQCESDAFCRRVLAKHWPGVPCYHDVRDVDERAPRVDLVCGGFPCQPFSWAGKRAAKNDRRYLWPEMLRVIRVVRPRYAILENVPGLLERGFGTVLGDLAKCGYDAEWQSIPAAALGLPQRRFRVFVVAYSDREHGSKLHRPEKGIFQAPRRDYSVRLAVAQDRASQATTVVRGMDDGVPGRMDRNHALGNAVVPQVAEWIGRRIMESVA